MPDHDNYYDISDQDDLLEQPSKKSLLIYLCIGVAAMFFGGYLLHIRTPCDTHQITCSLEAVKINNKYLTESCIILCDVSPHFKLFEHVEPDLYAKCKNWAHILCYTQEDDYPSNKTDIFLECKNNWKGLGIAIFVLGLFEIITILLIILPRLIQDLKIYIRRRVVNIRKKAVNIVFNDEMFKDLQYEVKMLRLQNKTQADLLAEIQEKSE